MDFQRMVKSICEEFEVIGIVDECSCIASFETHGKTIEGNPHIYDWPFYISFTDDVDKCRGRFVYRVPVDPKKQPGVSKLFEIDGYYVKEYIPLTNARDEAPRRALEVWDKYKSKIDLERCQ